MSDGDTRTSVTVRIAGEEHVLRSTAEPQYTRDCANLLDSRIQEIRELSGIVDSHRAVILAALSITDRYFQTQDELDRMKSDVISRASELTARIRRQLDATDAAG